MTGYDYSMFAKRNSGRGYAASVLLVAVMLGGALFAGCGSSDETSTVTKAAYVKKANALCKAARADYFQDALASLETKLKQNPGQPQDELELQVMSELFVPAYEREIEEIRALEAPEGDEDQIERILAVTEEILEEVEQDPKALQDVKVTFARSFKLAKQYGIDFCGQS